MEIRTEVTVGRSTVEMVATDTIGGDVIVTVLSVNPRLPLITAVDAGRIAAEFNELRSAAATHQFAFSAALAARMREVTGEDVLKAFDGRPEWMGPEITTDGEIHDGEGGG